MNAMNAMDEHSNMSILYLCYPRAEKYIESRGFKFDSRIIQHQSFGFYDYNNLQLNAFVLYQIAEYCLKKMYFLNSQDYPILAVCIFTSTERPEAIDKELFILVILLQNRLFKQ